SLACRSRHSTTPRLHAPLSRKCQNAIRTRRALCSRRGHRSRSVSAADLPPVPTAAASSSLTVQQSIAAFLQKVQRPMRLLVAVSGGSDSVGLLIALKEHATADLALMAATVDHGLRSQSADEARDVALLCSRL